MPGLFPPGGCYLRKFNPVGTPCFYWGRLDKEWDPSGWEKTRENLGINRESLLRHAVILAYGASQPDLCLALCDCWERDVQQKGYGGEEYRIFRAACLVNQGKFSEANTILDRMDSPSDRNLHQLVQTAEVQRLIKAAKDGDAAYSFQPGDAMMTSARLDAWLKVTYK